jgi:hypothetical protein
MTSLRRATLKLAGFFSKFIFCNIKHQNFVSFFRQDTMSFKRSFLSTKLPQKIEWTFWRLAVASLTGLASLGGIIYVAESSKHKALNVGGINAGLEEKKPLMETDKEGSK